MNSNTGSISRTKSQCSSQHDLWPVRSEHRLQISVILFHFQRVESETQTPVQVLAGRTAALWGDVVSCVAVFTSSSTSTRKKFLWICFHTLRKPAHLLWLCAILCFYFLVVVSSFRRQKERSGRKTSVFPLVDFHHELKCVHLTSEGILFVLFIILYVFGFSK